MSFENQIKEILKARLEGTATEEELAILREWLDRSPQNRELLELLEESAECLPLLGRIYGYDQQRVWGNIRKAARRHRIRTLAVTVRKYAAAAAVAALLAGGYRVMMALPMCIFAWSCMLLSRFTYHFRSLTVNAVKCIPMHLLPSLAVAVMTWAGSWYMTHYPVGLLFAPGVLVIGWSLVAEPVFQKYGGGILPERKTKE